MKSRVSTILIVGLFVLAGLTVLIIERVHRGASSAVKESSAPISGSIPPAPPLRLPPVTQKPAESRLSTRPTSGDQNRSASLLYDDKISLEDNLKRLKAFCRFHENDPQLQQLLSQFVRALFEHAKGQFTTVKLALEHLDGPTIYRNIVLDCLIVADGPISQKADLVWGIATDKDEPIESRRLATHLTMQFADGRSRPGAFLSLLNDSDSDIVILALKTASFQMDDRSYNIVKTSLLASTDINVRIAAVDAIGSSIIADKQAELLSIIDQQPTSKATIFSDASLLKRKAIAYLDLNNPQTYALDQHIALDTTEDPSVRAAAISRLTPKTFPLSTDLLLGLLQNANSDDAVLLAATEDSLLTTPTPNVLQAIRTKADELSDPQLRNFMIKRLEKIANGANP
jgi:hypothetical protein